MLAAVLGFFAAPPTHADTAPESSGAPSNAGVHIEPLGTTTLDDNAIFFVSFDGLVNNASYQQSGILTHEGYQYAAWWTENRSPVLARRPTSDNSETRPWETLELDHELTQDNSHNTISLGISVNDGRLHVGMDTHNNPIFYTRSEENLLDGDTAWDAESFEPITRDLLGLDLGSMTYPRFVPTPEGDLQFNFRTGQSGNGTQELAEYSDGQWTHLGGWTSPEGEYRANGSVSDSRNAYLHGLHYDQAGRLHAAFTWRETAVGGDILCHPGGLSNHDTGYVYSDDRGRTWHTGDGATAAVTGTSTRVSVDTANHVVDRLELDYALMNQESQATDSHGDPHVMISYRPGRFGHCSTDFVGDREDNGRVFHLWRGPDDTWRKTELPEPLAAFGRSQLVMTPDDTAYAVLPYGRIMAATADSGWSDWSMVHDGSDMNAFGEVLVDRSRVESDGVLSVMYQEPGGGSGASPLRVADFRLE
ncbi:BNR repeat-containing protein [Spiractinospora alimapuensis]|uniref:BNR repeat-containing protein n=1 Tax=Spiractinospora alimapuensis TaxID=2820884 RepID=UPI001F353682|nr:BNR repeat-containing protein [Spiractinospora alimapuensis]